MTKPKPKPLLITTLILIALDIISTTLMIYYFGLEIEGNGIGVWLYQHPIVFVAYKLVLTPCLVILLYQKRDFRLAKIGLWLVAVVYLIICIKHIVIWGNVIKIMKGAKWEF